MTQKIRGLKSPPLLSPPPEEMKRTPWLELRPREIDVMYEQLRLDVEGEGWRRFAGHLANMRDIGLDTEFWARTYGPKMTETLLAHVSELQKDPESWHWMAALELGWNVKRLGFDSAALAAPVKTHLEKHAAERGYLNMHDRTRELLEARDLGIDVSRQLADWRGEIEGELDMPYGRDKIDSFTVHAGNMRRLGWARKPDDWGDKFTSSLRWRDREIRAGLHQNGYIERFTEYAAAMRELEMLTPNPLYQKGNDTQMPPLKKFRTG